MKQTSDFTQKKIKELSLEFKQRRKYLNLSQIQLSKLSGLSQSIITKFENNKIDPTLSTIYKIEQALQEQEYVSSKRASDIMVHEITSVSSQSSLFNALQIMRETDFSQLLVINSKKVKGIISEKSIVDYLLEKGDIKNVKVKEILQERPLIVPDSYTIADLSYIFKNRKTLCVLVGDQDSIEGIITKSDLFK